MPIPDITYRMVKQQELTFQELDNNFHNLDQRIQAMENQFALVSVPPGDGLWLYKSSGGVVTWEELVVTP